MQKINIGLVATACFLIVNCISIEKEKQKKPNIIFILIDDLSWGDTGVYGQQKIKTSNIDRNTIEGIRFTNAYADFPEIAAKMKEYMQKSHEPSDVWPSPGQTQEEFLKRLKENNTPEKPENIALF